MIRVRLLFICLLLSLGIGSTRAGDPVFERFERDFGALKTLEARFTQKVTTPFGDDEAAGELWLKRPDLMKWEYRTPEKKLFLLQSNRYLLYVPADKQLIIQNLDPEDLDSTPLIFLLGGRRHLEDYYIVERVPGPVGTHRFILTQKENRTPFERVMLELSGDPLFIREITLYENNGSTHFYRFDEVRFNPNIPDSTFRFTPPKGVEIIRQE